MNEDDKYFSLTVYQSKSEALLFTTDYTIDLESRESDRYNQQVFYASKVKQLVKSYFGQEMSDYQVGDKTLVMRRYEDIIVIMTDHKSIPSEVIHKEADFFFRVFTLLVPASKMYPQSYVNVTANLVGYYKMLRSQVDVFRTLLRDKPTYFLNAHGIIAHNSKEMQVEIKRALNSRLGPHGLDGSYYILFSRDKIITRHQPPKARPLDDTDVQILLGYVLGEYGGYKTKMPEFYANREDETSTTINPSYETSAIGSPVNNLSYDDPYHSPGTTVMNGLIMSEGEEHLEGSIQSGKSSNSNNVAGFSGPNSVVTKSQFLVREMPMSELSNETRCPQRSSGEMTSRAGQFFEDKNIERSWSMFLCLGDRYPRPCLVTFVQIAPFIIQIWITPKKTPSVISEPSHVKPNTREEAENHREKVGNYRKEILKIIKRINLSFYDVTSSTNLLPYMKDAPGLVHAIVVNRTTGEAFTPEIGGFPIIPFVGDLRKGTVISGASGQGEELEILEIQTALKRDIFQLMMRPCQSMAKGFSGFIERGPMYTRIHTLNILEHGSGDPKFRDPQIPSTVLRELGLDKYRQSIVGTSDYYQRIIKYLQERSPTPRPGDKPKRSECLIEIFALFLSVVSFSDAHFMLENFVTNYAIQLLNLD